MADGQQTLDLMKPGKLWATAEHHVSVTFHLAIPQAGYTKDAMSKNPTIAAADELMTPFTAPASAANKNGVIEFDLAPRAGEITTNISARNAKGQQVPTARVIVVATAKTGNKVPDNQVADVFDLKVAPIPSIKLAVTNAADPLRSYATVPAFKNGASAFIIEFTATGTKQVTLGYSPAAPGWNIGTATQNVANDHDGVAVNQAMTYATAVQASATAPIYILANTTGAAVSQQLASSPGLQKVKALQQQLTAAENARKQKEDAAGGGAGGASWGDYVARTADIANEDSLKMQIIQATYAQATTLPGLGAPVTGPYEVKDGQKYVIVIPVPFKFYQTLTSQRTQRPYSWYYIGGQWRKEDPAHPFTDAQKHEGWRSAGGGFGSVSDTITEWGTIDTWEGGKWTLTVTGTGAAAGVKDSTTLTAEAFADKWMVKDPPPPFAHNAC